ncbi:hypothetical protein BJX65DRAFT_264648 [Aspergillus insuetus]
MLLSLGVGLLTLSFFRILECLGSWARRPFCLLRCTRASRSCGCDTPGSTRSTDERSRVSSGKRAAHSFILVIFSLLLVSLTLLFVRNLWCLGGCLLRQL